MPYATHQRARDEDGALYFEDWSAGRDEWGLWLWPEPSLRVLAVRPVTARCADLVRDCGGVIRPWHRYDTSSQRDWHVPVRRWRQLRAAMPVLARQRREYIVRRLAAGDTLRSLAGVR